VSVLLPCNIVGAHLTPRGSLAGEGYPLTVEVITQRHHMHEL